MEFEYFQAMIRVILALAVIHILGQTGEYRIS